MARIAKTKKRIYLDFILNFIKKILNNSSTHPINIVPEQIVIKVNNVDKDISLLNKVVSESTKAGANQIDGITFESSNIENLKQEARILAINDAKSKAVDLSSNIGVSLGDIVGWWENVVSPTVDYSYSSYGEGLGGGSDSGSTNISVGDYEVVVELNLNYKIKK